MSSKSEPGGKCEKYSEVKEPPPADGDAEAVEGSEGILAEKIFSNHLIRYEILKNLSVPDLLKASLVCKEWRDFCRETLQEDRRCLAKIQGKFDFENLKQLIVLLETSVHIPFNGLHIAVHPSCTDASVRTDKNEALGIASAVLSGVDIKYLSIRVDGIPDRCKEECPFLSFAREILKESAESLEELNFIGDYFKCEYNVYLDLLGVFDEGFLLPNLRRLGFPSTLSALAHYRLLLFFDHFLRYDHGKARHAVQRFTTISPNLEELTGSLVTCHLGFLLPRDLAWLVKDYHIVCSSEHLDDMFHFALTGPKLRSLEFSRDLPGAEDKPAMQVLRLILESSKKSLKTLQIGDADLKLIALRLKDIPVLGNVEHLRLGVGQTGDLWREGTSALRMLNWSKYFPNLKQVCIDYTAFALSLCSTTFWEKEKNLPVEYPCDSVTKIVFSKPLRIGGDIVQRRRVFPIMIQPGALKNIFPNVKVCWINQSYERRSMDLSEFWSAWPDLLEICIFGLSPFCDDYMDDFIGISKEEAEFVWKNVVEGFESLEVVPAKPNILYFQKLKKLVVQFDHGHEDNRNRKSMTPFGGYVFLPPQACSWIHSRMPGLVVEIDPFCRRFGQSSGPGYCHGLEANVEHLLQYGKLERHDFRPYF